MNWQSLKVRYAGATILLVIFFIITILTRYIVTKFNEDTGFLIDTAGGQRMRAVNLAYLANRHHLNPDPSYRKGIEDAITDYQARIDALLNGGALGISRGGVGSETARTHLANGIKIWNRYKLLIKDSLDGRHDAFAIDAAMQGLVSSMNLVSVNLAYELKEQNAAAMRFQFYLIAITILLAIVYIFSIHYYTIVPMQEVEKTLKGLSAGNLSARMTFTPSFLGLFEFKDEVYRVKEELNKAIEGIANLIKEEQKLKERSATHEKFLYIGYLTSQFAHELNNPLTSLIGFTELLLNSETDPSKIKRLESIYEAAMRCENVVQNLVAFGNTTIGKKVLTDINKLVEDALGRADKRLRAEGISIKPELAQELSEIMTFKFYLREIMLNLINNSCDAMKDRKGEKIISIRTLNINSGIRIEVTDNGCGIPESNKDKIFLPFFSTKDVSSGYEFRLSTSYRIIEEHGGQMTFTSKEGEGTTFIIELPLVSNKQNDLS